MQYKDVEIYQTPGEIKLFRKTLQEIPNIEGVIVEVGVYQGATAAIIREENKDKDVYLFDTFEGLPDKLNFDYDPRYYEVGHCGADETFVRNLMKDEKGIHITKGVFPESGDILRGKKIAFAHIDVDIYESTKECLEYIYPMVSIGGKIIVHDYPAHKGVKVAVDDFLKEKIHPTELGIEGRQIVITKI